MKLHIKWLAPLAAALAIGCSDYDDSSLQTTLDDYRARIAALQQSVEKAQQDLAALKRLTEGNVITSVAQDSDGRYVITYRDNAGADHSITVATDADVLAVPLLAVAQDADGLYYWTVAADGQQQWLLVDGKKVAVCGPLPDISVTAEGFWMVAGNVVTDRWGNPIVATAGGMSVFTAVEKTADGWLKLTLGSGETLTLEVCNTLNLRVLTDAVTLVADPAAPLTVAYEVAAANPDATVIVALAQASGLDAAVNTAERTVAVTFPAGFTEGHIILSAYDMEHTVVRPVVFRKQ